MCKGRFKEKARTSGREVEDGAKGDDQSNGKHLAKNR